jgi:flagellar basal-body rod protein FlgG
MARQQTLDSVANNLANVDTLGFKKDSETFKEHLAAIERAPDAGADIPRGPIKDKDFYPLDGKDQSFVVTSGTYTNFQPGHLKVTQGPLDLAVDGPGFFEVSTPSGVRYTRQGSFMIGADGTLVTKEGYPVLAAQPGGISPAQLASAPVQPNAGAAQGPTPDVVARYINMRDYGPGISITDAGEIYAHSTTPGDADRLVAKLSVAEFPDTRKLRKEGNLLFVNPDPKNIANPTQSSVKQGVLETSNVNPVEEMTNLIKANRFFEHDMRALKTYGEMMGKEANEIGKL